MQNGIKAHTDGRGMDLVLLIEQLDPQSAVVREGDPTMLFWYIQGDFMHYSHREYPSLRRLTSGRVELLTPPGFC